MNYCKHEIGTVHIGAGDKPLTFFLTKQLISKEQFTKIINGFVAGMNIKQPEKEKMTSNIYRWLADGKIIQVDSRTAISVIQ